MLVYRLYKSIYIADPLSAEGARRASGRWNTRGFPILYTSATPELALLEIITHLNPAFIPSFHLLVLEIPDPIRTVSLTDLPSDWREDAQYEPLQTHLADWLTQPNGLSVAVPSSIVPRSTNYLLHTLYDGFHDQVRIVENEAFAIDSRLYGGQ